MKNLFILLLLFFSIASYGIHITEEGGGYVKPSDSQGRTPLHRAVMSGDFNVARSLIKMGADVNARDNSGYTILQRAIVYGDLERVKFLIDNEADVNATSPGIHFNTLMFAVSSGNLEIIELLRRQGADLPPIHSDTDIRDLLPIHVREAYDEKNNDENDKNSGFSDGPFPIKPSDDYIF